MNRDAAVADEPPDEEDDELEDDELEDELEEELEELELEEELEEELDEEEPAPPLELEELLAALLVPPEEELPDELDEPEEETDAVPAVGAGLESPPPPQPARIVSVTRPLNQNEKELRAIRILREFPAGCRGGGA